MKSNLVEELKKLIEENLDPSMFPYAKGNSIRIGSLVIRENKKGFHIHDLKTKDHIATTFSKTAAVAIAKNLAKGHNVTANVIDLDKVIEKNFSDALFYSHTLRTTKDEMKKEVTETRLDIAKIRTEDAKRHLDCMIFN
ncbi:hypothetical protein N9I97_00135 [bacterium]|nr:hypothetical protein [bacterium]